MPKLEFTGKYDPAQRNFDAIEPALSDLLTDIATLQASLGIFNNAWIAAGTETAVATGATVVCNEGTSLYDPGSRGTANNYVTWGDVKSYLVFGWVEQQNSNANTYVQFNSTVNGGTAISKLALVGGPTAARAYAAGGFTMRGPSASGATLDFSVTNGDSVSRNIGWRACVVPLGVS